MRFWLLGIITLFCSFVVQAIDCTSVLPGPAQSYDAGGSLYMQNGARIINYPARDLCFAKVAGYEYEMSNQACGSGKCEITKIPSVSRARPEIPSGTDSGYYTVSSWTTQNVVLGETKKYGGQNSSDSSRWDVGELQINGSSAMVSFSDSYSVYVMKSLTFYNNGTMTLAAGKTYIVDGSVNLSLGNIKVLGSEPTALYINGNFKLDNLSILSGLSSLDVYVTGDLLMSGDPLNFDLPKAQGSFYVEGNARLTNNSVIQGRVSAKNVSLEGASKIIYDDEPALSCYPDNFNRAEIGNEWIYSSVSGSSAPYINSNRLNVTQDKGNQASSITYQRLFPGNGNLVQVEFDYFAWSKNRGTGGDGLAIILSDAAITPQPGSYGGALGYAQRNNGTAGFAGGWIGVGLDEYGNFSNPNEGKVEGPGFRAQAIAIRGSAKSNYKYLAGTSANLSPTIDKRNTSSAAPNHKYRLTVDSRTSGKAMISLERDTKNGSGYQTLISPFDAVAISGQGAVPEYFYISLTGSTGGSTNNHELDNFNLCALKSNPVGKQIDHFEFDHSGQALTCNPEEMTIRACADASCSTLVTDKVTAVLSPSSLTDGGWTPGGSVTFTGGTSKVSLRKNTAGSITIGVSSSTPATKPLSKTLCRAGSGALSEASCTLSFADSGFIFDVPDIIANKAASNVVIKAVKKDESTKQCIPGFASTSKTLNFWSDYIDPVATGRPESRQITVNGTPIGWTSGSATPLTLAFNAQGQTTLSSVNYTDAGKMQLNARYTGLTGSEEEGLLMNGSDQFVSRPVGLCILPETVCAAGNSSCAYFRRAGESFSVGLTAQAWESDSDTDICAGNQTTPNFALAGIALGSTLVAPTGGVSATVGTASYNHAASSSAQQTVSQSLSEVGVFRLTATPPSYLGTTIPSSSSAPVGRITPYDFALTNPSITAGCGSFSYMGQPMPTRFTVAARNRTGGTTANYREEFAPGQVALVAENGDNGVALSSRLSGLSGLSWQAGLFTTPDNYAVTFARNISPDGPFSQLAIGVSVADNEQDVVIPLIGTNMNAATAGSCGSNCDAVTLGVQDLRHGRLKPVTGRTSASNPLALPLTIESYTASGWQRNADDGCTRLDLTAPVDKKEPDSFLFDRDYVRSKAELTLQDNHSKSLLALTQDHSAPANQTPVTQPTSSTAKEGYIWLHFSAPGISDRVHYRIDLSRQPQAPIWLNYDWDNNGIADVDDMSGWAFFNQWRSSDRVIYRRELLQ